MNSESGGDVELLLPETRRRVVGDAHRERMALTLCGSCTRGAGSPQAAWYSAPLGDTNSQRGRRCSIS